MLGSKYFYLLASISILVLVYFCFAPPDTFVDKKNDSQKIIYGGIVPHHLLVNFIIDDFFKGLSKQNIKTIILIGPNHEERGGVALSNFQDWETKSGKLSADKEIISDLLGKTIIKIDENTVAGEVSISALTQIIKLNLPQVKIVPIILSQKIKKEELISLAKNLSYYVSKETIIVASVDFSHYLTSDEADKNDETSFQAIKNFDYETILHFNSDYLDSPPAIVCLLLAMKKFGTDNIRVLRHTNSGELANDDKIQTTSYFSMYFLKKVFKF